MKTMTNFLLIRFLNWIGLYKILEIFLLSLFASTIFLNLFYIITLLNSSNYRVGTIAKAISKYIEQKVKRYTKMNIHIVGL